MAQNCRETSETIAVLQSQLSDLRILLMNEFLGDVFGSEVPHREPRDPKYSRLQDVATPGLVADLDEAWLERALSYRPPDE